MNKPVLSLVCGATAIAALSAAAFTFFKYDDFTHEPYTLPEDFTVTAHTGCEGTADNTLESIRSGASADADIVEIDLHFTADGTPVLSHNTPASSDLPTLESAFELLSTLDIKMNVDVKSTKNIPEVISLAQKHSVTEKIFFTGVEEKDVEAIKSSAPGIPYYLNVRVDKKRNTDAAYLDSLVEKVKNCGAIGINMNYKGGSKELVAAFRNEGLLVSLWTANSKQQMYRCLHLEPDNITTRKPSLYWNIFYNQFRC